MAYVNKALPDKGEIADSVDNVSDDEAAQIFELQRN
jgi:hypothetical protein